MNRSAATNRLSGAATAEPLGIHRYENWNSNYQSTANPALIFNHVLLNLKIFILFLYEVVCNIRFSGINLRYARKNCLCFDDLGLFDRQFLYNI